MATIHAFRPRPQPNSIAGLYFWALPRREQIARVRALVGRGLSIEQVSSMCHETCATVRALAEAQR
mgnify:CR=1 FL=1